MRQTPYGSVSVASVELEKEPKVELPDGLRVHDVIEGKAAAEVDFGEFVDVPYNAESDGIQILDRRVMIVDRSLIIKDKAVHGTVEERQLPVQLQIRVETVRAGDGVRRIAAHGRRAADLEELSARNQLLRGDLPGAPQRQSEVVGQFQR